MAIVKRKIKGTQTYVCVKVAPKKVAKKPTKRK